MVIDKEVVKNALLRNLDAYFDGNKAAIIYARARLMPLLKDIVEDKVTALKKRSETEILWCKFRDAYLLPGLTYIGFVFLSTIIDCLIAIDKKNV